MMNMVVDCENYKCRYFGLFGCKLNRITLNALGSCRQCDYEEDSRHGQQ